MKKTRKKWVALVLALALSTGILSGCGSGSGGSSGTSDTAADAGSAETKVLKMGHVYGDTYPMHLAMLEMSDYIYEHTDGRYRIEVYPNSSLGGESDLNEGVQIGTIDMSFTATTPLANLVPAISALDLPFLIEDYDHADAAFFSEGSEVRAQVMSDIDAAGFKALALCENGFRQLYTNKNVQSLADLKGLKVRVMENQLHLELWNALGASPTAMSASEALTGIQQGTVDAVEMFHSAFLSTGFSELCKYYVKTNHIYTCGALLLNQKIWNSMSAEDQKVFEEAALTMMESTNNGLRASDEDNYSHIVNDLVDAAYELDTAELQAAVQSVYNSHPEYTDMVAKIQALAK